MKRIGLLFAHAMLVHACGAGIKDDPNRVDPGPGACVAASCDGRCGEVQDGCGNALVCEACASSLSDASADTSAVEASACQGQPAGWSNELVDAVGDAGRFPSLAVDASGTVHVSSYEASAGALRYARRAVTGGWTHDSIDTPGTAPDAGDLGMGTSLALDAAGAPTIAYYDLANRDARIARRLDSGSWVLETVDASGDVGGWPSVVIDDAGAHVTYYDRTSKTLAAAHRDRRGSWSRETVDALPSGWQSSLAKDRTGGLHVTYSEEQRYLRYAFRSRDGKWQPSRVDDSEGLWSSLVVDALGGLHVSYCSALLEGELRYRARPGPIDWTSEPVESQVNSKIGWSSALGIDASGAAHIAYIHRSRNELRYAYRAAGSATWSAATTLDAPGTPSDLGRYVALAVDRERAVHIAYYDARSGDLRYARRCP